jgi:hypothetical protein
MVFGVAHISEVEALLFGSGWFGFASTMEVRNDPEPVPLVGCADRASWNIKRPCGVAFVFQVSEYFVQAQLNEASNVFSNDPIGPKFLDESKHVWPEMSGVVLGLSGTCDTKGLTRESSHNNIWSGRDIFFFDIFYIS